MEMIQATIDYFYKGGLVMWPLLFCSIAVMSIAIERFLYYKAVDSGMVFADEYCSLIRDDNISEAKKLAEGKGGYCADVIAAAYAQNIKGEHVNAFFESQANVFIAKIRAKLDYLSIIVTLSPLLGLLGTIIGMIGAFSIFNVQAGAPLAITGGIGEALIATATGLCVAILSLCAHSYLAHRVDNMITDMEQCFSAYIEADKRSNI